MMRGMDKISATLLVGLFALIVVWPTFASNYKIGVGFDTMRWAALALSWVILSGMTGYFSFGHVVFFGLGAYIVAVTWLVLPWWGCVLLSGVGAAILAVMVGYPCLRVRGPYFVILTFGVAEFVKFIVINIEAGLSMSGRMLLGGPSTSTLYYSMGVLAVAAFFMAFWVRQSRFGAGLRAIREDEDAAGTLGIPVQRYKLTAFVLSAIIPGMVGALFVIRGAFFEPPNVFDPRVSLTMIAMAIMGGSDDPRGTLIGVAFLALLSEYLWANFPQLYAIIVGILLVVFVLAAPDGIWGRLQAAKRRSKATQTQDS